jgi:hypothetical protein
MTISILFTGMILLAAIIQIMSAIIMENKVESCTQVEVRYYLQCRATSGNWLDYPRFPRGFKTERSATRTMKKTKEIETALTNFQVIKQTRTIEIKTTTTIEVINEN